ncbi:hypothetical protein SynA1562_00139 [Synechococcus sp. A15-62]|nr:hypothetical protein SynA1562_00139 [Synechococcus sp. A15-62]
MIEVFVRLDALQILTNHKFLNLQVYHQSILIYGINCMFVSG